MQVTLPETCVTLLSSTKDVVKAESTKEDSIVLRPKGSQSVRSTSEEKQRSTREIESVRTISVSKELRNL